MTHMSYVGVRVHTNQHGRLALRISSHGRRAWVGLKERDDGPRGEKRTLVEAKARLVAEALRKGRPLHLALIDVLGDCPPHLVPEAERSSAPAPAGVTLREHAAWWVEHIKKGQRKSYVRKATSYTNNLIVPFFGDTPLTEITSARVLEFQDHVLARRRPKRIAASGELVLVPITIKTAKNIVTVYFRAMIVQAMARHRVPNPDPFPGELLWPKPKNAELLVDQEPDPFEAWERDKILDWYLRNDRLWYPFVYFQFWTGCRPSETSALREANVDLERGTVRINKSRDEGEESLPKTRASRRTIALYPNVVEVLRTVRPKPLDSTPESYFFTVSDGRPIFTRDWPRDFGFYDVLMRLKIRQRKFYCTRHTSISWQLTTGANPWGVAKYHGTSMAMIDAHYGKWIPEKGLDQAVLRALAGGENGDLSVTFRPRPRSSQQIQVVTSARRGT